MVSNKKIEEVSTVKAYARLMKIESWMFPIAGILMGGIAVASSYDFLTLPIIGKILLVGIAFGPFLLGSVQTINHYADRHVDAINKPWRPIPSGRISHRRAIEHAIIMAVIGLVMLYLVNIRVFLFGLVFLLILYAYSLPPIRLRNYASTTYLSVGVSFGFIPVLTGWSIFMFPETSILLFALVQLIVFTIFIPIKDFEDIEGDKVHGIKSMPLDLGMKKSSKIVALSMSIIAIIYLSVPYLGLAAIKAVFILLPISLIMVILPWLMVSDPKNKAWTIAKAYAFLMMICMITIAYNWVNI